MVQYVNYTLEIFATTGQQYSFNSSGSSAQLGGATSFGSFEASAVEKEQTINPTNFSVFIPWQDDIYPDFKDVMTSPTLVAKLAIRYSIVLNGVSRVISYGYIENAQYENRGVEIEVLGYMNKLTYGRTVLLGETCRYEFGSANVAGNPGCGFNLALVSTATTIVGLSPDRLTLTMAAGGFTDNELRDGFLIIGNYRANIALNGSGNVIYLWEPIPNTITLGTAITVTVGCPKTVAACRGTFNNFDNFGGSPYDLDPNLFGIGQERAIRGANETSTPQ